jgi:hypothetical protein
VKRELAIWKKLNHDNIVHLVEIIDDPGACARRVRGEAGQGVPCVRDGVCRARRRSRQAVHDFRVCGRWRHHAGRNVRSGGGSPCCAGVCLSRSPRCRDVWRAGAATPSRKHRRGTLYASW